MNLKKLAAGFGLALSLLVAPVAGQAALLSFEDDDIDFVLRDVDGTLTVITSGTFQVDDIFVSALEIPVFTIDGVNAIPTGQELTGVVAIQITSIAGPTVEFAPYTGGLNEILALGTDPDANVGTSGDADGGAMIALWLNDTATFDLDLNRTSNPATNCTSLADCIYRATGEGEGTLFQVDGFAGDLDESWIALASEFDIGDFSTANNGTILASFNFNLTTFFNASGPIGFIDIDSGLACPAGNAGL